MEARVRDALDRAMVGRTITIREGSVTYDATGEAILGRETMPCHFFGVGDQAIVSLWDDDGDGVRQFLSQQTGFFLVQDGKLSPELAMARRQGGSGRDPLLADGVTATTFMDELRQAAQR